MKTLLYLLAVIFIGIVFWAIMEQPFSEGSEIITSSPWGILTLVDLYLGFFIFSGFIYLTNDNKWLVITWCLLLFVLGNVVSLIYIAINYQTITHKFRGTHEYN